MFISFSSYLARVEREAERYKLVRDTLIPLCLGISRLRGIRAKFGQSN